MKAWAKEFYQSAAWKRTRAYIFQRDFGLCVRCGAPGDVVHHKEYLTPSNINDADVTLSEDNLETLCRQCHALEHQGAQEVDTTLAFDEDGNVVERIRL